MKAIPSFSVPNCVPLKMPMPRSRAYWTVIYLASLACGGNLASAQTTNAPPPQASPAPAGSTNVTKLQETTVVGQLDTARNQITADLGATTYQVSKAQIIAQAQGENAPFNQVLLRTPGVAEDG